ncbi:MAG: CheR family methyltransferase [Rhodocyclaceae bacterium]|nr:CheR family methyltransferase [Rhodocyclaceae bacterium]MDZ4213923.1 CheR family methyltransferase [Rhodocyclaceae bacterium]
MTKPVPSPAHHKPRNDTTDSLDPTTAIPLIGVGCSAGGLQALESFFSHVPEASGMAFVVVQHLDPTHVSVLPELLQPNTSMRVIEITDGMVIEANSVYVIPPNKDVSLLHGKLHLLEPIAPRGLRLPIDFFLRSLAEDRKEKAIGIVLSGMGSDGVFGLRAIKEKAGLTLVQEPATAQSDSMPRSAIGAGVADIVAPPEMLAGRIANYLRHPSHELRDEVPEKPDVLSALDRIIILLRDRSGNDFSLYKTNTLHRRIERRMAVHQISVIDDYVRHLRANPVEIDLLFKELLIGVTNFFRDPEVWETLRTEALPLLLGQHAGGKTLRAWVAACSTGEEAYSLAIIFREVLETLKPEARFTLQIYATDLDAEAIEKARKGYYPDNIAADITPERLARYFIAEEGGGYRINKNIREMVVFATQNVIADPPFTKLDILTCRNLLIYFGAALQKTLLPLFHYALNPGGLLLLGSSESIGNYSQMFSPLSNKARIFRQRDESPSMRELVLPGQLATPLPDSNAVPRSESGDNLGQLTDQLIQQRFAPAAVLVNSEGDIVYISGRTGKYLEPAAGKTNVNIHAMARAGLREALVGVIFRALKEPLRAVQLKGVRIEEEGSAHLVDVTVQAIEKPEALRGRVLLVFKDAPAPPPRRKATKQAIPEAQSALRQELEQTREALQVTHEEMQTTVEELKSSNEELQSTNEELQSTNEEMTTSREELQSLNEELQTVNAELQSKVDDLTWVRNDMTNLLNSTEIATIFLDNEMRLRRFTTHATKLFKLIPGDVGRPLSHVVTDLDYPQLKEDALDVLRTLMFQETVAATHDGRWFRVRIMPYRTQENVIDGVVITFTDITGIKQLEAELRKHGG